MLAKGYKYKKVSAAKLAQVLEAGRKGCLVYSAQALQRRKDYNASPKHCLECGAPLLVSLEDMDRFSQRLKTRSFVISLAELSITIKFWDIRDIRPKFIYVRDAILSI
jgi:hypothetical protein